MNDKRIPKEWAQELALLHDKIIDLQDFFNSAQSDIWCGVDEATKQEMLNKEGIDLDSEELQDELNHICETLDELEAITSELDCDYNDYD